MGELADFQLPDVGGLDFDFGFSLEDFDLDFSVDDVQARRYQKPRLKKTVAAAYKNAIDLAKGIELYEGFRAFCLVSGNFIFGDLIEALSQLDKIRVDKITIHTLTMSQDSIDSLHNVIVMDQPSQVHVIMSDYWYAHECGRANGLLYELYDKVDIGEGFRLAFCRTHAKIVTIQTKAGHKIVMHGSANMRSHGVIEQVTIESDSGLYDFVEAFNDGVLDEYDIINHGVKRKKPVREKKAFDIARKAVT